MDDAIGLSPPVGVETFRDEALSTSDGEVERVILFLSHAEPLKKIDNSIRLAKLLKYNNIGNGMKIVGCLEPYYYDHYLYLKK